ncbi:hypothetical protein OG921_24250 [Aldersonia sp. NBC_00410]|uniref:hypothetical protein n=1 Tax=Aldersonia sp. NBC_00410 TaxID=2975954 RepID=UPI0022538E63|nr:hypothetical protein [Aldersonia sp. NBC_00410]MCX5046288.1 hypothetical protein [Aldersonia sp. NBC_00410]
MPARRIRAPQSKIASIFDADPRMGCFRQRALHQVWERCIDRLYAPSTGRRSQRTVASARVAARRLCAQCPILGDCEAVAAANAYTGIAGGKVFVRGKTRQGTESRSVA